MALKLKLPTEEEIAGLSFEETKELAGSIASLHEQVRAKLTDGVTAEIQKLADLANLKVIIGDKPSRGAASGTRATKPRVDASARTAINDAGASGIEEAELIAKLTAQGFPEAKSRKALTSRSKGNAKWFTRKGTKYFPN